jgi:hypothetical protein
MEQLFDHFANLPALNQEKEQVLRIFQEIETGVANMARQGVRLDTAQSVREAGAAVRQYEQVQRQLEAAQQRLAQVLQEITRLQATSTQGTQAQAQAYQGLNTQVDQTVSRQIQLKEQLERTKAAIKDIQTLQSQGAGSDTLTQQLIGLTRQEQQLKLEIQANTKYLKNQTQEMISQEGSLDGLRAKLNQLLQEYDKMSAIEKGTDVGTGKLQEIQQITASLNEQEQAQGRFFRNVGNYANSLSPLFKTVEEEISSLKTKQQGLQDLSQKNPIGFQIGGGPQQIAQITSQLQQLEQVQQIGFKTGQSYTQQINSMSTALQGMEQEGKQSTQFLDQFRQKLNEAVNSGKTTNNFSSAFKVLESELSKVKQQLNDPALSGKQLAQLRNEEKLLTQLTDNLGRVFNSSRQELRAYMEASVQLGSSFGDTDARVLAFQEAVGEATNKVQDLKKTIQFQAKDNKYLEGAVAAVHGLAGAYGAAAGAVSLFGDDDQKTQEKMMKLQAILTVVTSLQAVMNTLETESGAVQTLLAAKMGLVNAARALQSKFVVANVAATEAEAAAAVEATAANEAMATSNAAVAESAAVAAEGEVAMAEATEVATVATKGFGTALIATGIGAAIAAIVVAAYFGLKALGDWIDSASRMAKINKELKDTLDDVNKTIIENSNIIDQNDRGLERFYQKQLENAEKSGQNQYKLFQLKKVLAQEEANLAQQQADRVGASYTTEKKFATQMENMLERRIYLDNDLTEALKSNNKDRIDAAKGAMEIFKQDFDVAKTQYDAITKALRDKENADKNVTQLSIEEAKFSADERRKLILTEVQLEVDMTQAKNASILANDRSTLKQRIEALRSNAEAQKRLAEAEFRDVKNDPSTTNAQRLQALLKLQETERKINLQTKDSIFKTNEEYRMRDLAANENITKRNLQIDIDANKAIVESQVFTFQQRLKALQDYSEEQKKMDQDEYKAALQRAGLSDEDVARFMKDNTTKVTNKKVTDAELLDIAHQFNAKLLQDDQDRSLKSIDILQSEFDKQKQIRDRAIKSIQSGSKGLDLKDSSEYAIDLSKLNQSFSKGELSYKEYYNRVFKLTTDFNGKKKQNETRELQSELDQYKDIEDKLLQSQQRLNEAKDQAEKNTDPILAKQLAKQVEEAQKEVDVYQDAADKKVAIEEKLQNLRADQLKQYVDKAKELEDQLAQAKDNLFQTGLQAAQQIGDAFADEQKQAIQDQIDQLDAYTQAQIEAANNSVETETKKQARIKAINAEANKEKLKLTKEQKKIDHDKAVFDNILKGIQIGSDTVAAVAKIQLTVAELIALSAINPLMATLIPLAQAQVPVAIATGAIQEAAILASPIPGYFMGTDSSRDGTAYLAERGRELAIDTDGRVTLYDKPTMAYLKGGTKVLPNKVTEDILSSKEKEMFAKLGQYGVTNQAPMIETKDIEILAELKELNKKSRVVIYNESGIESSAYYQHQMKR